MGEILDIFRYGSRWLRADFHLHTRADKEFIYKGEDTRFVSDYVEALKKADIHIGAITNHNKFDYGEFKALRKKARKNSIFLMPGVELSVNDGANGIHMLIIFGDEWVENANDYISPFITSMFPGKSPIEYENENGRSDKNVLQVVEELDKTGRDYFIIFAHVEQRSGLWFEMSGGRIRDFREKRYEAIRRRTLAFQKVRTNDKREKVKSWLGGWYPAEVEGSDPKSIEDIGKGEPVYLKIGHYSTAAVMYCLVDYHNRVSKQPIEYRHSHILDVSFEGGALDGKTICFSPELNTLIGIRGSGKSSIIETIRYGLDIPFGEKTADRKYKESLVDHILGSGGKITIRAVDVHGQQYEIRRINKELPDVYVDSVLQPGIAIRETILHKPIYFGQKDLSATSEGFEKDLVEKLVGEKLEEIRFKIEQQKSKVLEVVSCLKKLSNVDEKIKEYADKKKDAEFKLQFYKEHGVEKKLKKQINFDKDGRKCLNIVNYLKEYLFDFENFIVQHEDELKNKRHYESKENKEFFEKLFEIYDKLVASFDHVKEEFDRQNELYTHIKSKCEEFEELRKSLKEEFAEIERKLTEELKASGAQSIRPDEFRELQKVADNAQQMLSLLKKDEKSRQVLYKQLLEELAKLNTLWLSEYRMIKKELDKVNESSASLKIRVGFKEDKQAFLLYLKTLFRGSKIRESTLQRLVDEYSDFGAILKDFDNAKALMNTSSNVFERYFFDHLEDLLLWQVPNRYIIEYRGKELKHHSLGQRASALILFVLSQKENHLFLIDQPEDDLDNQTIYEDVIKLIRSIKKQAQFIFATHNANFPVLGDAEQIISCQYVDDHIGIESGSVDVPKMQKEIVDIMEGGEEAFNQRKRRYEIWKPQS